MAEINEQTVRNICRDLIDQEKLVSLPFCRLRHDSVEKEVEDMKKANETRDGKLDSIHRLAYGILGGIIITLAVQVIGLLGKGH